MNNTTLDYLSKPDKRKKKTSLYQYKQYLKALEDDEIFRTGFIPPGHDANYLSLKWKELAEKLNEDEKGPKLSAEEWKKRLMDWKHTTRAKERRINEGNTHLRMTPLEVRFMELWGCVPTIINIANKDTTQCDVKIEKVENIFEEALEESQNKEDLENIGHHELQILTATSEPQLTLTTSTPSNQIKVVEQIQITAPEKKIQIEPHLDQPLIVTENPIEKKKDTISLISAAPPPPPLKRMRTNNISNISQTTMTQIPMSIASSNEYHETSSVNTRVNSNAGMTVTSATVPTQINTTRDNLQLLAQALNPEATQTTSLPTTSEIAYTISTLQQDHDSIPVIDVQSIALQIKRLAEVKEQKLRFEIEKFKFKNPGFKYNF